jgi:hypothetical protein
MATPKCKSEYRAFRAFSCALHYTCLIALITTTSNRIEAVSEQDLPSVKTVVELREVSHKGVTQLYGELDCGEVSSGERIAVEFDIVNKSETVVEFHALKPSCSCVDVKIAAGVLKAGSQLATKSTAHLTVPRSMGKNAVLGEVAISDQSGSSLPVATIVVRATVLRPFLIRDRRTSLNLSAEESVSFSVPFDLDPNTSVDEIKVNNPLEKWVDVTLDRDGATKGFVRIRSERSVLLREQSVQLEFLFESKGVKTSDDLQIDFYDGTKARIVPGLVPVHAGRLQFIVFCLNGIDHEKLQVLDGANHVLKSEVKALTQGAAKITLDFGEASPPSGIVVSDGKFQVPVSVSFAEE